MISIPMPSQYDGYIFRASPNAAFFIKGIAEFRGTFFYCIESVKTHICGKHGIETDTFFLPASLLLSYEFVGMTREFEPNEESSSEQSPF